MFGRNSFVYTDLSMRRVIGITVTVWLTIQVLKGIDQALSPQTIKLHKKIQDKIDNL
jgi:hypothetical protein